MIDERMERLITRRLDGELTEDESLELDKQLIRSPEARSAFEESQHIDALAVDTFRVLLNGKTPAAKESIDGLPPFAKGGLRGGSRTTRRLLDGAIGVAAAVLLVLVSVHVLPLGDSQPKQPPGPKPGMEFAGPIAQPRAPGSSVPRRAVEGPALAEVIAGPRHQQERIDQDIIGVVDPETQSIYLLELQTARNMVSRMRANY